MLRLMEEIFLINDLRTYNIRKNQLAKLTITQPGVYKLTE